MEALNELRLWMMTLPPDVVTQAVVSKKAVPVLKRNSNELDYTQHTVTVKVYPSASPNTHLVFDWEQAARLIVEKGYANAVAGYMECRHTLFFPIFKDDKLTDTEVPFQLASLNSIPALYIDGKWVKCWRYYDPTVSKECITQWPDSALAILNSLRNKRTGLSPLIPNRTKDER